jgi:hypothetical protein
MESGEIICRYCHEREPFDDLIAPCNCSGSIKWVHRHCLDVWRTVSPNPESFTTCDNCKAQYRIIEKPTNDSCLKLKFISLVALDFFIVLLVVNAVVIGFGFLGVLIDPTSEFIKLFPGGLYISQHLMLRVYCFGGLVFCAFLGLVGLCFACCQVCLSPSSDNDVFTTRSGSCYFIWCGPYFDPVYGYYWGPWGNPGFFCIGCGNCNHNDLCRHSNSGGDAKGLLVVLCIFLIILALIGLIFGIIFTIIIVSRILQRHYHILQRKRDCRIHYVVNLANPREVALAERQGVTIVIPPPLPTHHSATVNPTDEKFDAVKLPLLK